MLPARKISRAHKGQTTEIVTLSYDERFLRRKRLTCESGASFMVDLAETTSLNHGDALILDDGRAVAVRAAEEPVIRVSGNLPRLAWHIGNRHTPCQIAADHLVIRRDPVIEAMLRGLGASLSLQIAPFTPEGGAYGHGRTMGHDHGLAGHFAQSHV
jgi:urease accessory protein